MVRQKYIGSLFYSFRFLLFLCLAVSLVLSIALAHDYDPYPDHECSTEDCTWIDQKLISKVRICNPCDDDVNGQPEDLKLYRAYVCEKDCLNSSYNNCRYAGEFSGQRHWIDEDGIKRTHTRHVIAIFQLENIKPNQWYFLRFECEDQAGNISAIGDGVDFIIEVCEDCYLQEICCWNEFAESVPCYDGDIACFQEPMP